MTKKASGEVSIGKFDILATYTYVKGLLDGRNEDEAKQRGMVAAIMVHRQGWAFTKTITRNSNPRRKPPSVRKRRRSPPIRLISMLRTRWASSLMTSLFRV